MSQLFASNGQNTGVSALPSVLPMNNHIWDYMMYCLCKRYKMYREECKCAYLNRANVNRAKATKEKDLKK